MLLNAKREAEQKQVWYALRAYSCCRFSSPYGLENTSPSVLFMRLVTYPMCQFCCDDGVL